MGIKHILERLNGIMMFNLAVAACAGTIGFTVLAAASSNCDSAIKVAIIVGACNLIASCMILLNFPMMGQP